MGELYLISFPNGKGYIGITSKTAKQRFASHLYSLKRGVVSPLYHAMRKYGAESATIETLAKADDWKELCQLERDAIVSRGTRAPYGYNATDGGDGAPKGHRYRVGLTHTDEAKAKMSRQRMGRPVHSTASRAAIGAASKGNQYNLGRKSSEETRRRQAASHIASPVLRSSNTSGVKGVSWCRQTSRWRAHITLGGKMKTLGRFQSLEDAASARRQATDIALARTF